MSKKINIDMEENIRNYSKEIITIHDFVEAVRKTVGQYLGYVGNKGFMNMIREIFQNAIDELMKDASPCNRIILSYDERNHSVIVEDNGRGIPFVDIIRVFTAQHTGSNYVKKEGEFSSGRHGVGSKVTNAVSSTFTVRSYILGEARMVEFIDGKPSSKGVQVISNAENRQGTVIHFRPCYDVMKTITTTYQDVLGLVLLLLPLLKIGAVVDFNGIDLQGIIHTETLVNEMGIITNLIQKTTNPLIPPVVLTKLTGIMKADIAFTYDSNDLVSENITAFSNFCPTLSGTHVDGFTEGLTKFFRDYMNKIYLSNNSKITICNSDIKTGLKCIISVAHLEPLFTGQAKEILSNEDMYGFVRQLTIDTLTQWVKENPSSLQKLCKWYKEIAENRVKSDEGKIKISSSYQSSVLTGYPKKFIKPNGNANLELVCLEGDSGMSAARNGCCKKRQGLFPVKGKIPNAFEKTKKDFFNNIEIQGFFNLVGWYDFNKKFDISKCIWEKIIIMTDGDVDGAHIRSLFLRAILRYAPELIVAGRVFGAVPPLYGIKMKNGKYKYFTGKLDFIRYIQSLFSANNKLCNVNGSNMTVNESINLLFTNMEFVYDMDNISNTYAINPFLLETCLIYRNLEYSKFKAKLEKTYRFITVRKEGKTTVVEGLVDSKYQTVIFNEKLINSCSAITDKYLGDHTHFMLNDEIVTLYGLMKAFAKAVPPNNRYKGIGEMNSDQLSESALHPDSNRTLIQFTVEDLVKELESIRYIESNRNTLLKDLKVSKMDVM